MEARDYQNLLESETGISLERYLSVYANRICQDSERLFVSEFLYPIFGADKIKHVIPQYPFIDSEGRIRKIDFGICYNGVKIALEVNGETYHAEGIIPGEQFDDNLNRQNEILSAGWYLLRFSYSQLKSPKWRGKVFSALQSVLSSRLPMLIDLPVPKPRPLQNRAMAALDYYRGKGWKKAVVILPTGTGKTFLAAWDSQKVHGKILFIVHRLEILKQAKETFSKIYPNEKIGLLTGEEKDSEHSARIVFASKDSLCNPETLRTYINDEFDYIIVDEVHHGQAVTYKRVLQYFNPKFFMLGLTATPDRTDRKDILELFDYQKAFEYTLTEAIDDGFLVPYSYYGLTDNIDYNNIHYNGSKYRVEDLDRTLIIPDRNQKILEEYMRLGDGNKAIGFCCSIKHAKAMAEYFQKHGLPAVAITSEEDDQVSRTDAISGFRNNRYSVAFTVDMFNEGIDFPNVRVLLFLRPTESKTVFTQQLGRGLRLCGGKDKVVILDFIGNYKKANIVRKLLCKGSHRVVNAKTGRIEKIEYEYSPKCEVHFDAEVETIMDAQDTQEREISKEDLVDAYYTLKETLGRRPTPHDINAHGEFKIGHYLNVYGGWTSFLKSIGEFTEFSYHFPQGTHLGHILYVIDTIGKGNRNGTYLDDKYVRFAGGYASGTLGNFQRQTKYKLQAAMEMGLLVDFRQQEDKQFALQLTADGKSTFEALKPFLATFDFAFSTDTKAEQSWTMPCENEVNGRIANFLRSNPSARSVVCSLLLKMPAVELMLRYLYSIQRKKTIAKQCVYSDFFKAPFVKCFLDEHGLDDPTDDVVCRRLPFLFNLLEATGVVEQDARSITILKFVVMPSLVRIDQKESIDVSTERARLIVNQSTSLSNDEVSWLRETYGADFLTQNYYLPLEGL